MNVKEVTLERSFPVGPKFEMQRIVYTVVLEEEENRLEVVEKLCRELDAVVSDYAGVESPGLKAKVIEPVKIEPTKITVGDNTQRIRDVKDLIPNEFRDLVKSVYVTDDRVYVEFKFTKAWEPLRDFMQDVLKAKYSKEERRWRLP